MGAWCLHRGLDSACRHSQIRELRTSKNVADDAQSSANVASVVFGGPLDPWSMPDLDQFQKIGRVECCLNERVLMPNWCSLIPCRIIRFGSFSRDPWKVEALCTSNWSINSSSLPRHDFSECYPSLWRMLHGKQRCFVEWNNFFSFFFFFFCWARLSSMSDAPFEIFPQIDAHFYGETNCAIFVVLDHPMSTQDPPQIFFFVTKDNRRR